MNTEAPPPADLPSEAETRLAALFANLILQHTELAMMLLGLGPKHEGEQPVFDLDHAQMVIDQLEMLEAKTRGNLSPPESALLKQSLMRLRLAFVEAVDHPPAAAPSPAAPPPAAEPTPVPAPPAPESSVGDDSKKRFSKKY